MSYIKPKVPNNYNILWFFESMVYLFIPLNCFVAMKVPVSLWAIFLPEHHPSTIKQNGKKKCTAYMTLRSEGNEKESSTQLLPLRFSWCTLPTAKV